MVHVKFSWISRRRSLLVLLKDLQDINKRISEENKNRIFKRSLEFRLLFGDYLNIYDISGDLYDILLRS